MVDFPGQWRTLCEAVGFVALHEHRAWLVEDKGNARALFDFTNGDAGDIQAGEVVRLDGNKVKPAKMKKISFFRRLAEAKGSPRIDWETIFCFVKPEGGNNT